MSWETVYHRWLQFAELDCDLRVQLDELKEDTTQLEDCFYTELAFGTGGMRGLIGPGTNRMNIYTVRKAAEGLARYIEDHGDIAKNRGVVIAYDSRHMSPEFAMEAAKTLGYHDIQVYLFKSVRTTPELSFAVRYLHAFAGIVITASHNPAPYNGFKVYGEDGAQFASAAADVIVEKVNEVENELLIPIRDEGEMKQAGLLSIIGETVDNAYLKKLQTLIVQQDKIAEIANNFHIVYTPLHGTGSRPVQKGLLASGFTNVHVVTEQAQPDSDFPTVTYPNPEEAAAFEMAIAYGEKYDADLLLATDPDADRVGVAVKKGNGYTLLTGNQIGALLLYYLITEKKQKQQLPKNATVIKTIVTSELGKDIATAHGLETIDTLTGFKYISEKIREFEADDNHTFLFGYEESYGYLIGDFVRDKDAVQTCLLIAEVAASYKLKQMTLHDALQDIFKCYGFYKEGLESLTLEGKEGVEQIAKIMQDFRQTPPESLAGKRVQVIEDYETGKRTYQNGETETITLPTSNVLKYKLEDDAWICIRPSGTEPKIKFYFGVKEESEKASEIALTKLTDAFMAYV